MADSVVTLDLMAGGSAVAVDSIGGTAHQYTKMEFGGSGTATPVTSASPLPVVFSGGTINNGTINAGTVRINTKPLKTLITIGSVWGTSSGTAGTLIAAPGAGTSIFINDISISNDGTSTLKAGLSFGTAQTGTAVVKMVGMAGNGGIEVAYPNAVGGHFANTPLVMWTTGSGTASFNVSYWTEAQ